MVTVAVVAILAVVAVPSLRDVVQNNRLRAGANELVAALQAARMEAVRLNSRSLVCRSTDGATCANSGGDWTAWVVMADVNHDGNVDDLVRTGSASASVQIANSPAIEDGTIVFRPDGMARTDAGLPLEANLAVCIPSSSLPENRRIVSIAAGSRFSVSHGNDTACAAPTDP